jgi:hypothetical protein
VAKKRGGCQVPNEVAAVIIGKGGANIMEVRQQTGAGVKISPGARNDRQHIQFASCTAVYAVFVRSGASPHDAGAPGVTERTITITGTPEQISAAVFRIRQVAQSGGARCARLAAAVGLLIVRSTHAGRGWLSTHGSSLVTRVPRMAR